MTTWKAKFEKKDCATVYLCTHLHNWSANYTLKSNIFRVTGRMWTIADFAVKPFSSKHLELQTSQIAWNCFQHIDWLILLTLNKIWKNKDFSKTMPHGQGQGLTSLAFALWGHTFHCLRHLQFIRPNMWSPNCPDLNLLVYVVWGALQQTGLPWTLQMINWNEQLSKHGRNCRSRIDNRASVNGVFIWSL